VNPGQLVQAVDLSPIVHARNTKNHVTFYDLYTYKGYTPCLKNNPDIFDCVLKKNYQISSRIRAVTVTRSRDVA